MGKHNDYWNGLEDLNRDEESRIKDKHEFSEDLPIEESLSEESLGLKSNRRDFLKIFGFGITAATLAACVEKPVKKAIPYVVKPENITPGRASWFSSTCQGCSAACGILVKNREGRPIKIEGNPNHSLSQGGVCAVGQSTVLSLYDVGRLTQPKIQKSPASWKDVDKAVNDKMGSRVAVLTGTYNSPTGLRALHSFLQKTGGRHVQYDAYSYAAIREAHHHTHNNKVLPSYNFEAADVIVSFEADFLGSWISPVEFTRQYSNRRRVSTDHKNATMSRHYHFEGGMSLTGSNADYRAPMKPSQIGAALVSLLKLLKGESGGKLWLGPGNLIQNAANDLKKANGRSLVICGHNDVACQAVVNEINKLLGNYGKTVDVNTPSNQALGDDITMKKLVADMNAGAIDTLIMVDVNPVYDYFDSTAFTTGLGKVKNSVIFTSKENETSEKCNVVAASHHFLESWGDANPRKGVYSILQPQINPLYDTRQAEECFLRWSGDNTPYDAYLRRNWENNLMGKVGGVGDFLGFWEKTLRAGAVVAVTAPAAMDVADMEMPHEDAPVEGHEVLEEAPVEGEEIAMVEEPDPHSGTSVSEFVATLEKRYKDGEGGGMQAVLYQKVQIRDGSSANNPWLQEMPDPITKVTWDNYVCVPYKYAQDNGLKDGDLMNVSIGDKSIDGTLPVLVQPGQHPEVLAVALGYGRTKAGKVAEGVGRNAFPSVGGKSSTFRYHHTKASATPADGSMALAKSQTFMGYELDDHQRQQIESRNETYILKETTLDQYRQKASAGNVRPSDHHLITLWDVHDKKGHHWAMAIDLNACTGCGSCIVSCNAENNIPVVGKDEVRRRRDMHWMRIDRYYRGNPAEDAHKLEVTHQPMLCQHCDNAPCESVCPVLATVHSDDGLNQQVYNRCIGTRYCANNCPYKVRRFNWFRYYENEQYADVNYAMNSRVGRLVLNPDVTVRARGVMEKCSFCVQRIQAGKLQAKGEGRMVQDSDIKTACQQSCPANAIVFGDLNNLNSEIRQLYLNKRGYHALEDVKTLPSVAYMTKVRNKDQAERPQIDKESQV